MTPTECVQFVAYVKQMVPAQRVEEYTPDAWHGALADIPLNEAVAAAQRVVRSSPWIDPHSVVREWKAIRAELRRTAPKPPALPGPYEEDADRDARIARGIALCRASVRTPPRAIAAEPADESERIRQAALDRAHREPRERRTDPTAARASFGDAVRQIRSSR